MSKPTIDTEILDRYVDATVALFMEYYSVAISESIHEEMCNANNENVTFPKDLDNRCRMLIKKECRRQRYEQHFKGVIKGLRYVASFAIVLLSLSSVLFMTVEAFRAPIINYYIEQHNGHWEIFSQSSPSSDVSNTTINLKNPLRGLIPDEYQLIVLEGASFNEMTAIYENSSNKRLYFSAVSSDNWIAIDSENAQISKQHELCGYDAITVVKDGVVTLTWIHSDLTIVFTLIADDMSESDIIAIGEQLISLINQ